MILLSLLVAAVVAVLLLSTLSDLLSALRVTFGGTPPRSNGPGESPRLLFLVPAHNEELLIASCIRSLMAMRYPSACLDVVVIADNCTDRTSEIATSLGAQCLARSDQRLTGKPHAIAWAVRQLTMSQYEAMVIVDADAIVDPAFAEGIAEAAPLAGKAVQPFNDVRNPAESAVTRMAAVLAGGLYRGSFPLKRRAGLNVPLGCGMCVGRDVLASFGWEAFSLSEDWEWYAILAAGGVSIDYAPRAHLYAQEAKSLAQSGSQRQRWMAGKLTTLIRRGPEIVRSHKIGIRQKLDAIAELSATGPAVHLGVVAVLTAVVMTLSPPYSRVLSALLLLSLARPLGYAIVGLATDREPLLALRAFMYLPVYTVWRLFSFAGTVRMLGDKPWIRTERHEHSDR